MINPTFSESLSRLTDRINKAKFETTPTSKSFPLDRLKASILFMLEKKDYFNNNLGDLTNELIQMQNDALKLYREFNLKPDTFQIVTYIKELIKISKEEEYARKHPAKSPAYEPQQKKEKVKIFRSVFNNIENDVNKFLSENDIEITRTLQSVDNNVTCITIFYKDR